MKIFLLICLAAGLASTEKLDRTYLPPPGSKFSGGSPGDIQVPLEYPKETYLTGQPQPQGIPEIELSINRRPKPIIAQGTTQRPEVTKFRNNYPVPQTTTSYAITQTTTFVPPEDYEGLDQGSGFLNTTGFDNPGLPKYPQDPDYQNQLNQGRPGIPSVYNQYQPGQNHQAQNQPSTLAPYGTTQRPFFESNRKPEPYLPPVPPKGQTISGQNVFAEKNGGYPSRQPQGPVYQDGQQSSITYRPLVNQPGISLLPANPENQFNSNVNIPSSTAAPQYQGQRFGPTNRPNVNQQRFGSTAPAQQNLNQFPGNQNFASSTIGPQYQDKTPGQYIQNQNIPSTVAPQYQNGQRIINPESILQNQYISSTPPPQYQDGQRIFIPGTGQQQYTRSQNNYSINQNFPSPTEAPQYQNEQQFTTPGSVIQSQYSSSTTAPQYQGGQQFVKPGIPQGEISNQGVFGSRVPSQQYQKSQNFLSSTAAPQFQNGPQFVTPGSDQPSQFLANQNIPSTTSPQYQDGQRVSRPGTSHDVFSPHQRVFGSQVPSQQNQNQYIGNRLFPSTTAAPQFTNSAQFTAPGSTLNQYQSEGQQNFPLSTATPQYQFTSPESDQQSQYVGNSNFPSHGSQFQNGQRFSIPQGQAQYDSRLPNQGSGIRGIQQFLSTSAPQYQSTFSPTPGSNQQGFINVNQHPVQPNYNQRFPSSTIAPQQFVTGTTPQYGNQPIQTGPRGTTSTSDYNQDGTQPISGLFPTRNYQAPEFVSQGRPERPQAASDRTAEILSYENVLSPKGYSYSYDTSNGIHADETGTVGNGTRAQGGYSYTGDDGKIYSVFYSANENGFQPRGDHLPTPPPIPEAIQRVIEQANKDKESGISDDGSYNEEKYGHKKYNGITNQVRPENKNVSTINGADIPNRYESRIGTQNKKKLMPVEDKQAYRDDDTDDDVQDRVDFENLDDVEDDVKDKEVTNQSTSNKRPTKVKNLTVEDNRRKYNNKNDLNRRPITDKEQVGDNIEDVSISDETDLDESQNQDNELDLINYKDDPNSRTDFHGTNKYLPKPKGDRRRPMMPLDNKKTTSKGIGKHRRPTNRKPEISPNVAFEDEQDFRDDDRVRKPSRKNKISHKVDKSKFGQPSKLGNDDDYNSFSDSDSEYNAFDEKMKSTKGSRPNKPERNQFGIKNISKPVKSKNGGYETVLDNENVDVVRDEEKGYEYTPPQKKFQSGQSIEFPTRTSVTERPKLSQKVSQTTVRPFMTPNVYADDNGENTDDDMAGIVHGKPTTQLASQKKIYPGSRKDSQKYNYNVTLDRTEGEKLGEVTQTTEQHGTTPSRLSSGRYQSTSRPQYEEKDAMAQNEYNKPTKSQSSHRPGNKIIYNNNALNEGGSIVHNGFVSTTPLPPSVSNQNTVYQLPGKYRPIDDNSRIINAQGEDITRPGSYDVSRNQNSQGLVPSTTYRPNYVFGDRTMAPKGSVTVDGFGRPILSTTGPEINGEFSNQPRRLEETFRPTEGRFGVTGPTQDTFAVYQGSTSAPGEDFSGPKQPQRYDPETGYYYK